MAGAQLFGLQRERQIVVGERARHGIAAKTIYHADTYRPQRMRGINNMPQQGFAGERM